MHLTIKHVIALLKDRELFLEIFRDSRVFVLIMFANGRRKYSFVHSHADVSASVYNPHNLHHTGHIEKNKLHTVDSQKAAFSYELITLKFLMNLLS